MQIVAGGVVDSDYRGEIKIILVNNSQETFTVNVGDRIGQLILEKISNVKIQSTASLSPSIRGTAGFGSSGVGAMTSSSSTNLSEELYGTGQPAVRRLTPEHDVTRDVDEPREEGLSVGPHVFFDGVLFAREEETLPSFLRRLRREDLKHFKWMFPESLIEELEAPARRSPVSFQLEAIQGTLNILMFKHEDWRKKLYDSEVNAPPSNNGISAGVVTLGRLEDGRIFARVDNRRGNRSMSYLKQNWKGASVFYSMSGPNVNAC